MRLAVIALTALCLAAAAGAQERMREALTPSGELLKTLRQKHAPDVRTTVFTITPRESGDTTILIGDVASADVKKDVLDAFAAARITVVDSISVVPAKELGEDTWGIVTVSVANMRTDAKESAEMGSQTLMGSVVRVYKKKGMWYLIQSPDKYLGWADGEQFQHCTKEDAESWAKAAKLFVTVPYDFVKETSSTAAPSVCDVVGGDVMKNLGASGDWMRVALADGRTGYIARSSVTDEKNWGTTIRPSAAKLETTAKQFLGIPYLWGGTSVKGMDCSGFTRTVYLLNGVLLSRDASQQVNDGALVDPGEDWQNLQKGDLLFFGRKASGGRPEHVSHVAMYLENKKFIHSSGKIRISSLDPSSPLYDDFHVKNFIRAKRIMR